MTHAAWLIQIYEMTDAAAQASAADLLSSVKALTVEARTCDQRGCFLAVDCDASDALKVYEMVMLVDQHAELIHSTTGPALERVKV